MNKSPTLCLNMIVKNESKIITRLFDSVINIIDCYCICDTGSTDNTVELIKSYFENKNIPGIIVSEPFKNFAHNRNFALRSAAGMSDYVLLMDADMILQITNFNKENLQKFDSCYILQGNNDFYYQNLRIVKNNGLFSYIGVTHEYISTPSNNKLFHITKEELFITDYGDGGCKNDKFERDIKLLSDGIIDEPNNSERYHFYLANSYHDTGNFEKAIETYEKRIKIGGWDQEIWYSYYRIGLCYKKLGKMPDAIFSWMNAYNHLPIRVENLYEIINHYRHTSKSKLAGIFYNMAKESLNKNKHNDDKDSFLFLHNDVYTYKLDYEFTIFASYIGVNNINDQVVIVLNNCGDGSINNNLFSNMKFYKDVLKPSQVINFGNSVSKNVNNDNIIFYSSSASLINNPYDNGYLMNVRYVNYLINNSGNYLNCDKHIITQNKYIKLSKDLKITNESFLEFNFEDRRYIGIEDIRIFFDCYSNKMLFIGTGYHKNNTIGVVTGEYEVNEQKLSSIDEIIPFCHSTCEKNWVFVDIKQSINVIYKWYPLQICKINQENKSLELTETKEMPRIFSHARGSTCGFNYVKKTKIEGNDDNINISISEPEIWFILHMVSYENPRHYYHIFAVFDESMNLLRYSAPFKFHTEPIEYCLGLVVEDDRVLITYSVWDRETKLGIYDKKYIDSIIKYN